MNATKVNADPAESNGRLLLGIWRDSLHVTCGLTACTPWSALGPTLGNEYGKTLPFTLPSQSIITVPPGAGAEQSIVMNMSVCLSVSIFPELTFTEFFVHVSYGLGSVLILRHGHTLCSLFTVLLMMSYLHRNRWFKKASTQSDSTGGSTNLISRHVLKLTHQGQHRSGGAKSDIYDCRNENDYWSTYNTQTWMKEIFVSSWSIMSS